MSRAVTKAWLEHQTLPERLRNSLTLMVFVSGRKPELLALLSKYTRHHHCFSLSGFCICLSSKRQMRP
jgi:hypothetical protein